MFKITYYVTIIDKSLEKLVMIPLPECLPEIKSNDLWHKSNPIIRNICTLTEVYEDLPILEQPILSIDDRFLERPHSAENKLV